MKTPLENTFGGREAENFYRVNRRRYLELYEPIPARAEGTIVYDKTHAPRNFLKYFRNGFGKTWVSSIALGMVFLFAGFQFKVMEYLTPTGPPRTICRYISKGAVPGGLGAIALSIPAGAVGGLIYSHIQKNKEKTNR